MINKIKHMLANPVLVCGGIFLFSALSLMAALIAQFAYGLVPCEHMSSQSWDNHPEGHKGIHPDSHQS